ncbi:hypothetical protein Cgig2_030674 [Carnegiea gigantea]|uniref:Myb/SANT-like domain-containing protein n=1 Tax=Carnegiea gigantea TaxID=171969 RepID=A0A9Q1GYW3_9CARY|nr:hypothetical protein Cgig2_030674 [Carnegiea gigantea]
MVDNELQWLHQNNVDREKQGHDEALIEVLKDLVNGRISFKANNGFKLGFLNTVEEGVKPVSHNTSEFDILEAYSIIHDKVVGSCTSGFGWDSYMKTVVAENEVWKANVKDHPKALYYEDFYIIFGKDHATGQDTQGLEDIKNEATKKDVHESLSTQEPSERVKTSFGKFGNLCKRVSIFENLVKGLSEVASILSSKISATSSEISRIVGFDVELSEKCSKLNQELTMLELTTMERHRATRKIASELKIIDIYFQYPRCQKERMGARCAPWRYIDSLS